MRRGVALGLQHRWCGIIGVALQRAVSFAVLNEWADLARTQLEPTVPIADLDVL